MISSSLASICLLKVRLHLTNYQEAAALIARWSKDGQKGYVCFADAHSMVRARDAVSYRNVLNDAILTAPDGTPVMWGLRMLGARTAQCVDGPGLTPFILERAENLGILVGFYGGKPSTLTKALCRVRAKYPHLKVVYAYSPPFSELDAEEERRIIEDINSSGVQLLLVGLGCPKQELWMARQAHAISCVMLGVGAVFQFLAGERKMPPKWIQRAGLTWIFRILRDPRRMWRRGLYYVPKFGVLLLTEVFSHMIKNVMGRR